MNNNTLLEQEWNNLLNTTSQIYIYGAGKIGKIILSLIIQSGMSEKIKGFITTLIPSKEESVVNGFPVIGLDNFQDDKATIFVAVTDAWQEEICSALKKRNLNNYIIVYKYSFLINEKSHSSQRPSVVFIDCRELLIQQYNNKKFNRFDVIVRVLAIEQYYGENAFGMNLYAKMQDNRNPSVNNGKYHELAIPRFEALIQSFEHKGYDNSSEIIVDKNLKLVDGAHRLALAIYHREKNIRIRIIEEEKKIKYGEEWFRKFFTKKEFTLIKERLQELSVKWVFPFAGIIWPPAMPFYKEIIALIKEKYKISNIKKYKLPNEIFNQFIKGVYAIDSIAEWKVNYKIKEFSVYKKKEFVLFDLYMPYPNFRIKETGTSIAQKGEDLKKEIRNIFKNRIENYHPDVIIHTADNYKQSDYMHKLLDKQFSLKPFFESIDKKRWMIIKHNSDYLPTDFPNSIPLFKDIDIVVHKDDYDTIKEKAEQFLFNFADSNFNVRVVNKNGIGAHIRLELNGFLVFLIDLSYSHPFFTDDYINSSLKRREKNSGYYIPSMPDDCLFRIAEYIQFPKKKKHLEFIKKTINNYLRDNYAQ